MKIRTASICDADKILKIYRYFVENTAVSFETESPSVKNIENRIAKTIARFPWIVCEKNDEIAGYAYAGTHRSRYAYGWSVDVTVYVAEEFQRLGIGKNLYQNLLSILELQGAVNAFAGIALPNEPSIKLHESLGFHHIGTYENVGFKLGKWWDVGWWQREIQLPKKPKSLIPYPEISGF